MNHEAKVEQDVASVLNDRWKVQGANDLSVLPIALDKNVQPAIDQSKIARARIDQDRIVRPQTVRGKSDQLLNVERKIGPRKSVRHRIASHEEVIDQHVMASDVLEMKSVRPEPVIDRFVVKNGPSNPTTLLRGAQSVRPEAISLPPATTIAIGLVAVAVPDANLNEFWKKKVNGIRAKLSSSETKMK